MGNGEQKKYSFFEDGAYNTFNKNEVDKRTGKISEKILQSKTLSSVLEENNISHIDFLNIDVEESDLEVLESHNWNIKPICIAIEDHSFNPDTPQNSKIFQFLTEKGYKLAAYAGPTIIWKLK